MEGTTETTAAPAVLMGVGRRKTSTAVVQLRDGKGDVQVNKRTLAAYFPEEHMQKEVLKPLVVTELQNKYDIRIKAQGGGSTGQIGAMQLGIARALVKFDPALTSKLREHGLLTRDPRMKERKKYGQKGARKKFQWTKR
jgi:small subunit ribosomal protein S9